MYRDEGSRAGRRLMTALLLAGTCLTTLASSAYATGTAGTNGTNGTPDAGNPATAGAGGAGTSGGTGNGASDAGGAGGTGGAGGAASSVGAATGGNGGAAGSGGTGGSASAAPGGTISNSATISGGAGGDGAIGGDGGAAVGGNASTSTGGNGGTGGTGGAGGVGIAASGITINNSGTITGGNGGVGGNGGGGGAATAVGTTIGGAGGNGGNGGAAGAAISGSDLTIVNSGTINAGNTGVGGTGGAGGAASGGGAGATGSPGTSGAAASATIVFTGGTNSLTLQSGSNIIGNVVAFSAADTLALGGSINASFDVSQIGVQYTVFGVFSKTGSSTWTLTGTNGDATPWTISAGTLNVSADGALGSTAGGLTLNGGTLQWGASFNLSSLRSVTLGAGGGIFDTNGFNTAIGVNITGTGGLTKIGSGRLMLGAPNSYTGGTTVNAGTLQVVSGASLASTGAVTVNGGTLDLDGNTQTIGSLSGTGGTVSLGPGGSIGGLTVNQSSNTSYAGNITGTGSFTKAGTGTLILNGVNNFTGGTTVSAGTLEIGDASHTSASLAGSVTVGASGTLLGHGTFGGDVANTTGGTVTPGGSIGTMTVTGNYTQGSTSTLSIEVSPTAASRLAVTGTANLAGKLALVYDPGVYTARTYTIVSAGNVLGTFATVTGGPPTGVTQALAYGGTAVNLVLTGSGTSIVVVAPTDATIYTALGTATLDGAQAANDTVLAHVGAGSGGATAAQDTARADANPTQLAFNGRAVALNDLTAQLPEAVARYGGWYQALGRFASLNGSASVPGFNSKSGGFLAGIDRPVGDHLVAGIAAGYSHTDLSEHDRESGTIDTPRFALYGGYRQGKLALDATIGYAHDFIDAVRPITSTGETARSSHGGDEATAALQVSLRLAAGGIALTPKAGFEYVHLFEAGFSESGSPGFDLVGARRDADSLRPFIGASAARSFTTDGGVTLTPRLDLTYSHEVMATVPASQVQVGGGSFSIDGLVPSRDRVILGGGIAAKLTDRLALAADYRATLPTGNTFSQIVEVAMQYRF